MSAANPLPGFSGAAFESDANELQAIFKALLSKVRTSIPVQVVAVTNDGGVAPIGYVDIKPLVSMVTGSLDAIAHGVIYNVPYLRIQGGGNAVILDPQVGDIGIAVISDRDISTVKASKAVSPPGSSRRHDPSDAIYLNSIISVAAAPTQYVRFFDGGIEVVSPTEVHIKAPSIKSEGDWAHTGSITASEDVIASGVSLVQHEHGGVARGGAMTSPPVVGYPGKSASFSANSPAGAEL
ncbi:Gp138 family membrane-puncturing spike protein [Curvibacter lanceolatus]|uniref:Gp138 family membrane-puncturing spike protein n=1 Tax=Curvibacter lanceolatus TaxID=86182 RepID=UPI00037282D0|nr:Gp138 family membrane-puncturing spike protein [Curvibacter lanceolatus]